MNTHPEKWYIQLTPENYDEVKAWWVKQIEKSGWSGRHLDSSFIILSKHPSDKSHYWSGTESNLNKWFSSYKKITLEQFRQITKTMDTLPTKWYIGVTEENRDELDRWRQRVATSNRYNELLPYQHTILSRNLMDGSCYHANPVQNIRNDVDYKDYQEITLEQFRQITNQKTMTKSIQISRDLLNEYYEASTPEQKAYLSEHFKLDGTTTEEAIRGLQEMACSRWKLLIKKNHPECFPEDSKYFNFLEFLGRKSLIEDEVADLLGMNRDFIQIRKASSEYGNRSFYLDSDYNWELIQDGDNKILIPTKKVK